MAPNVTWNRADVIMNSTFSFQSMSAIETLMSCFCCGYYIRLYRCRNNRVCDIDLLINFTNELFLISYKIVFVSFQQYGVLWKKIWFLLQGTQTGEFCENLVHDQTGNFHRQILTFVAVTEKFMYIKSSKKCNKHKFFKVDGKTKTMNQRVC